MEASQKTPMELVREHVRAENAHDVEAIMRTFGEQPTIYVNGIPFAGYESIRGFYADRLRTLPGFRFDLQQQYLSDNAVVAEHLLSFRDKKGQPVEVPVCIIYRFDDKRKLAGERIYFNDALLPAMDE